MEKHTAQAPALSSPHSWRCSDCARICAGDRTVRLLGFPLSAEALAAGGVSFADLRAVNGTLY